MRRLDASRTATRLHEVKRRRDLVLRRGDAAGLRGAAAEVTFHSFLNVESGPANWRWFGPDSRMVSTAQWIGNFSSQ